MPIYTIGAPDGRDYEVEAPEGARKEDLFAFVQQQMDQEAQAAGDAERDEKAALYRQSQIEEPGFIENLGTGFGSGFTGTLESAALGAAALLDEEEELATRKVIQGLGDRFTPDGGDKDSITYGIGNALGSVGAFLAPAAAATAVAPVGIAGAAGLGLGGLMGMATQAGEGSERARAAGVSEDVRNDAIRKVTPVGLTEVVPFVRVLNRFKKVEKLTEKFGRPEIAGLKSRVQSASITGGAEAAQEVAQTFVQNLVEQGYNPNRLLEEGLIPAAGYGAGAGAIVQGIVDLFGSRRGGRGSAVEVEEDDQIDEMLQLTYDPYERVRMPDGSEMDVPKNDPNRLAALEKTRQAQESEEQRKQESSDTLNSILGAQESEDRQINELLKPLAEQQQRNSQQEQVMGLSGTRQTEVDPQGVIDATESESTPLIPDEYINRAGERVAISYTSGAVITKMAELGIKKEELVANGGTGKNKAYQASDITALNKSKKANAEPTVSPQMDMIDVAETKELTEIEETAEIEKMVAEDEAVSQQKEMKSVQDFIALELASNTESERLAAQTPKVDTQREGNLDLAIQQNSSRNRDDVIDAFEAKGTNYEGTTTLAEIARIDRSIDILDAKPEVAPATPVAELAPDLKEGDSSQLESLVPEKAPKQSQTEQLVLPTADMKKGKPAQLVDSLAPIPMTDEKLTELGVAKQAPMRKRLTNADWDTQTELTNYANNKAVPEPTKFKITKFLEGESDGQIEMFGPKKGITKEAEGKAQKTKKPAEESLDEGGINATRDGDGVSDTGKSADVGTDADSITTTDTSAESAEKINNQPVGKSGGNASGVKSTKGGEPDTLDVDVEADPEVIKAREIEVVAQEDVASEPTEDNIKKARAATQKVGKAIVKASKGTKATKGTKETKAKTKADTDTTATTDTETETTDTEPKAPTESQKTAQNEQLQEEQTYDEERIASLKVFTGLEQANQFFTSAYKYVNTVKNAISTESDRKTVRNLWKTPLSTNKKVTDKTAASVYFNKKSRPEDAIVDMVHDSVFDQKNLTDEDKEGLSKEMIAYFKDANREKANKAMSWVNANLSADMRSFMEGQLERAAVELERIKNSSDSKKPLTEKTDLEALDIEISKISEAYVETLNKSNQQGSKVDSLEDGSVDLAAYEKTPEASETREKAQKATAEFEKNKNIEPTDAQIKANEVKKYGKLVDFIGTVTDTLNMAYNALSALDAPLHPMAIAALQNGDLKTAYEVIAATSQNPVIRRFASTLSKNIGNTTVEIVDSLENEQSGGNFSPTNNKITIEKNMAGSTQVLMHEGIHAAISQRLANKSDPLTKQLNKIFEESRDKLSGHYGSQDLDEFISEAIGNPSFQRKLASIFAEANAKESSWSKFVNSIANFFRRIVGLPNNIQTLEQFHATIESMLAPAPDSRSGVDLNILASNNQESGIIKKIVDDVLNMEGGRSANNEEGFRKTATQIYDVLTSSLPKKSSEFFLGFLNSHMLAQVSTNFKIMAGMLLHNSFLNQEAAFSTAQGELDVMIRRIEKWGVDNPQKLKTFNWLTHNSTRKQVDPSKPRSTYKGDKLKIYDDYKKDWNSLGKEGQAHYNNLRDEYRSLYVKMLDNIHFKIDNAVEDGEIAEKIKSTVFDKLFGKNLIEPFFPLTRSGEFWLEYNTIGREGSQSEYVLEAFESKTQRDRVARELDKNPDVDSPTIKNFPRSALKGRIYENAPSSSFIKDVLKSLDENLENVSGDAKESVRADITQLFIDSLPETSFMRSMQARTGEDSEGREGFQESATVAFRTRAFSLSRQTIGIRYSEIIRKQYEKMLTEIKTLVDTNQMTGEEAELLKNEWELRVKFATNPPNDFRAKAARNANRLAFLGTIGFNVSSALVNLTQIPLMVLPYMAGKTDYKTAMGHLRTANQLVLNAGVSHKMETSNGEVYTSKGVPSIENNYLEKDGILSLRDDLNISDKQKRILREILPLVQAAKDHAFLNRSLLNETLGLEPSGKSTNPWDKITVWSAFAFHTAERYNRQIALIGTFLNEKERLTKNPLGARNEKNLSPAQIVEMATNNALNDTQMTNGGAVLATTSRHAQTGIGRVAMMYKSFGIQMYYTQFRMWKQYFDNWKTNTVEEAELKREAKAQLVGFHLTGLLLSGVSGMTLYGMVAGLANQFLLDDDDEDADTITRTAIGEFAFKGGVNQMTKILGGQGVDVASRIGLANLLVASNRYNFDPSPEKTIVKTLGGPAYGVGSQVGRGLADIRDGYTQRGFENILPSAFRNVAKTLFRYSSEGILTRRNDPIMGEIDSGLMAAQFFGFAPAEYTMNQERNQVLKRIDNAISTERSALLKKYYIASYYGDYDEVDTIEDKMYEFNDKHPDAWISPDSIKTSMKKHQETTLKMYNGVTFSSNMREQLEDMADEWDQGFVLFD